MQNKTSTLYNEDLLVDGEKVRKNRLTRKAKATVAANKIKIQVQKERKRPMGTNCVIVLLSRSYNSNNSPTRLQSSV